MVVGRVRLQCLGVVNEFWWGTVVFRHGREAGELCMQL